MIATLFLIWIYLVKKIFIGLLQFFSNTWRCLLANHDVNNETPTGSCLSSLKKNPYMEVVDRCRGYFVLGQNREILLL